MAIFHLSVQTLGRTSGGNALAAAAYRAGEKLRDYDYSKRKHEVEFSGIYAPEKSPEWCLERAGLWAAVEEAEKRKDAQLCREMNFALPLELNSDQRRALVEEYAKIFTEQGMVVDVAIHKSKDGKNPHAHMMLTMRELTPEGFGKKCREWNRQDLVSAWREKWAELANGALERAGHSARIDHRSLAAQGINREPTRHQGKAATHMPGQSLVREYNHAIKDMAQIGQEMAQIRAELMELEKRQQKEQSPVREASTRGQATPSAVPPTEASLEGAELLPVIARHRAEQVAAARALQKAKEELYRKYQAVMQCKQDMEKHNAEFKNMGFFKKITKTNNINKSAEELDKQYEQCVKNYEVAKSVADKAQKDAVKANAALEAVLAEYHQNTQHAKAKAQAKVQERRERIQERERQPRSKGFDICR